MDILAQESGGGAALANLLFFLVVLGGLYLLLIRPARARARALAAVRAGLRPGVRVITTAGLHATVVAVEGDTAVLEIAPGVHATFASAAVVKVLDDPAGDEPDATPDVAAPEDPAR